MYTKNGMTYSEPYKVLKDTATNIVSIALPASDSVVEMDAPVDDLTIRGTRITWAGGRMGGDYDPDKGYAYYKTRLVKARYSNDDQIAIMLNDDAEEMARMQAWRDWAAAVARKIIDMTGE